MKKILLVLLFLSCCLSSFAFTKPRWKTLPIHVYVPQNAGKYTNLMNKAFRQWQEQSRGLVQFKYVQRQSEADIYIVFIPKIDCSTPYAIGCTKYGYSDNKGFYTQNYIEVGTNMLNIDENGNVTGTLNSKYPYNNIYGTILHEIGHAIGLGHSNNKNSVMYPQNLNTLQYITETDIQLLKEKYR